MICNKRSVLDADEPYLCQDVRRLTEGDFRNDICRALRGSLKVHNIHPDDYIARVPFRSYRGDSSHLPVPVTVEVCINIRSIEHESFPVQIFP